MQVVEGIQELRQRINAADDQPPDPFKPAQRRVPIRCCHGEAFRVTPVSRAPVDPAYASDRPDRIKAAGHH